MKRRHIITALMLLVSCYIKADQGDLLKEQVHLSIVDQNPYDQQYQYELEKALFNYQRTSSMFKKIRNASLLYTVVPLTVGQLMVMLQAGGYLNSEVSVKVAWCIFSLSVIPLCFTIPNGIRTFLAKWCADEQIKQYEQKLKEHRWKMAYLGQSFTSKQIEQYEQKLSEFESNIESSDGWAISNLLSGQSSHTE